MRLKRGPSWVSLHCIACGKQYFAPPGEAVRRHYCSRKCRAFGLFHSKEIAVFMSHVWPVPEAGCWLHDGAEVGNGYASCTARSKSLRAHRWSYEKFVGPIPPGMMVRHKCDVPCCVNPHHLEIGTHNENMEDRQIRGRTAFGARAGTAKLTDSHVIVIKDRLRAYRPGMYTALGAEFGVDRAVIARIHHGKAWRHVT